MSAIYNQESDNDSDRDDDDYMVEIYYEEYLNIATMNKFEIHDIGFKN